ncbi:exopolysaccharide biosynthesis polyprenyl glycosylphosphotransferase [Streptomyces sp. SP18CS02]|uniref:exopolysaccharide biosynthesis polyprenyl glycosylphosphotransferase n=1 Tax=Streptomyces sp. SP18CS02 TaxID=3002531 RepID=UPI002E7A46E6|nr:exopolysaccharide biosynthesis polyprenyl glycosylphosphotransferase [Streptomyces sp. SP18CS02]MEE1751110.1 exopolysaccharide biosynthesis polyprenyl glycosylphosphotransferase [Streptomyces sp. SP18CS02]
MTTESTSVPSSTRAAATVDQAPGVGSLGRPRGPAADRVALPPPRPAPAPPFVAALVAADCAAVLAAALLLGEEQRDAALLLQLTAGVAALNACAGLYRPGAIASVLDEFPVLAGRAAIAWCAAAALLAAQSPERVIGLSTLAAAYGTHLLLVCGCRGAVHHRRAGVARARPRAALIVGPPQAAQRLAATLARHPRYGVRPVGVVATQQDIPQPASAGPALPVLRSTEEIHRAVVRGGVREVVFLPGEEQADLVALFEHYGCAGWRVGETGGRAGAASMSQHLWGHACRRLDTPRGRRGRLPKRALDVTVAALALLATAPLLLLCASAVRLSDGPGVLFRQERVGQDGRLFTLLKFRTLRPADDEEAATRWSVAHDERVSGVGGFLRRTSLDELPQLWNVLRGDMSLVGPRPERPYFVAQFSRSHAGYAARHRMPVGLTGLAQVHGLRGDTSIEDRCRFDNHYIDHWSLWQDVCILLRTAASLIRPAGS